MKIGIICPSEIALRRFMPALQQINELKFIGIGVCTPQERFGESKIDSNSMDKVINLEYEKAQVFTNQYGGKIFNGYNNITTSDEIDAIYIPLPPALHYKWAKIALENGKHVLMEKPSTIKIEETKELIKIAKQKKLVLHENYMFEFHEQIKYIDNILDSGEIGDIRIIRLSFGFPRRDPNDFRYNKMLGGGSIFDVGGYVIKYAVRFLGETAKIKYAQLNYINEFDVDIYGSAALVNKDGATAQIAFGMDNNYKCELEIWGSKGSLKTDRIFTAPVGFIPKMTIIKGDTSEVRNLPEDDSFKKSILKFLDCTLNENARKANYMTINKQAKLIDDFCNIVK